MGVYRAASVGYGFLFDGTSLKEFAPKIGLSSDIESDAILEGFCHKESLEYIAVGNSYSNADIQYIIGACMSVDENSGVMRIDFPIEQVDAVNDVADTYDLEPDFYVGVFTY